MSQIQSVRGTRDLMPEENRIFRLIENQAWELARVYGYGEIRTPLFEFSDVFHRTLGETSDVIHKETYTFLDRGGDSITLRPEGTAGVARAFVSEGLAQKLPLKFFYSGPMFRYERPQKGRYRQFFQLGVEALGWERPEADVECLALAFDFLQKLGLSDEIKLEINTLGDAESRKVYRERLIEYFQDHRARLSPDSQTRLDKNPLRILDSKDPGDREISKNAPRLEDSLNQGSKDFFAGVQRGLEDLGISHELNPHLVRGLDYYCHTVFEFTTDRLGAQGTVLGGGRYDGLIETMGGPRTPGVGWAAGIDRLADLIAQKPLPAEPPLIALIPADDKGERETLKLAHRLRRKGLRTEIFFSGNVGKKMKKANSQGAAWAVIIGSSEVDSGLFSVKDLRTGEQTQQSASSLEGFFKNHSE